MTKVETWEKRLALLSETLDEWVAVQRSWMYLETIFCAEDIQKQLPEEAAKFHTVDKTWKVSFSPGGNASNEQPGIRASFEN